MTDLPPEERREIVGYFENEIAWFERMKEAAKHEARRRSKWARAGELAFAYTGISIFAAAAATLESIDLTKSIPLIIISIGTMMAAKMIRTLREDILRLDKQQIWKMLEDLDDLKYALAVFLETGNMRAVATILMNDATRKMDATLKSLFRMFGGK
jgi:hypothetical protein